MDQNPVQVAKDTVGSVTDKEGVRVYLLLHELKEPIIARG
jgi:hypothetical protein